MTERLRQARRALRTLGEALAERPSSIVRDSAIKRFEYCFDLCWKLLSLSLLQEEGVEANSPKRAFREALRAGLLSEAEAERALLMSDDRNVTAHTYDEAEARQVYGRIRRHYKLLASLVERIVGGRKGPGRG